MVGNRENNFGALRLLFAMSVIFSHSPELMDGNKSREWFSQIFGTSLTLGAVAVDGFFIVSGYLIAMSFCRSKKVGDFWLRRVARIYPGFLLAYVFSFVVVGWLGHGNVAVLLDPSGLLGFIGRGLVLAQPTVQGAFPGLPYPSVNASVWTIQYEFACYGLLAALGGVGLLRKRAVVWGLLCLGLLIVGVRQDVSLELLSRGVAEGAPVLKMLKHVRLFVAFLMGVVFFLYRERIGFSAARVAWVAGVLLGLLFSERLAEVAVIVLGSYLIFWFAEEMRSAWLSSIGREVDVSYGVYLYAWPMQNLIIAYFHPSEPWQLNVAVGGCVALLGYLSWVAVEKPAMAWAKGRSRRLA